MHCLAISARFSCLPQPGDLSPPALSSVQQLVNGGDSASKYSAGLSMAFRPFLQTPYNFNVMLNKSFIERQIHGNKSMCELGNREMVVEPTTTTTDSNDSNPHARSPSINEHSPPEPAERSPGQERSRDAEDTQNEPPMGQQSGEWSPMVKVKQEHPLPTDDTEQEKGETSLMTTDDQMDCSKQLSPNQGFEPTSFYTMAKQEATEALK